MLKSLKTLSLVLITLLSLLGSLSLLASNFYEALVQHKEGYTIDKYTRMELISTFELCGSPDEMIVDCVLSRLTNPSIKITNRDFALSIVNNYHDFLKTDTDTDNETCTTTQLLETNLAIGHCYLVMNYAILDTLDEPTTQTILNKCLIRELGTLAYLHENRTAQFRLLQHARAIGNSTGISFWERALENNIQAGLFDQLKACYE